ncbi:MAG: hypothetical protein H7308_11910 [Chthonomonadaceae bacterium]|nr:hypothetical protein [Chthonomonadaceae bacterium]
MMRNNFLVSLIFVMGLCGEAKASPQKPREPDGYSERFLTPQGAEQRETRLKTRPEDLNARTELIAYYWRKQKEIQRTRAGKNALSMKRISHILWMVEHHPEAAIVGMSAGQIGEDEGDAPVYDGRLYEKLSTLWKRQIKAYPDNPNVQSNAAVNFRFSEVELSEACYLRAQILDARNAKRMRDLAIFYQTQAMGGLSLRPPLMDEKQLSSRADLWHEKALKADRKSLENPLFRLLMVRLKFRCEQYTQARASALNLLDDNPTKDGNIIHVCNSLLGQLALREKNVEAAKTYLSASGKTKGSSEIDLYGPDFALANDLLEQGERQVVLDYLKQVRRFWKGHQEQVDKWIKQVSAGETPWLGADSGATP